MFEQPILIYSNYCPHSKKFLEILAQHTNINDAFAKLNIDPRPKIFYDIQNTLKYTITEVPTIILPNAEYILSGEQAFKWLSFQIEQSQKPTELDAFNPNEMGSFSDPYSSVDSKNMTDAKSQCFKFVGQPDEKIHTPPEDSSISAEDMSKKQRERETFDNTQISQQQRKFENNLTMQVTSKEKDLDARYQQLLAERGNF